MIGWCNNITEAIIVFVIVILVYAAVLLYSWLEKTYTAKNINEALKKFHKQNNDSE